MSQTRPTHEELVAHIDSFARRHGHEDAISIVGNGLEPILEDQFEMEYDVRRAPGTPCIARLITDWDRCQHDLGDRQTGRPPHRPIDGRHADLWVQDDQPVAYSLHRRELRDSDLADLQAFAREWDLELRILPASYEAPNKAVHVLLVDADR